MLKGVSSEVVRTMLLIERSVIVVCVQQNLGLVEDRFKQLCSLMLTHVARYRCKGLPHNEHLAVDRTDAKSSCDRTAIYCPCPSSSSLWGKPTEMMSQISSHVPPPPSASLLWALFLCVPVLISSFLAFLSPLSSASAMIDYFCDTFSKLGDGGKLSSARRILVTGEQGRRQLVIIRMSPSQKDLFW